MSDEKVGDLELDIPNKIDEDIDTPSLKKFEFINIVNLYQL